MTMVRAALATLLLALLLGRGAAAYQESDDYMGSIELVAYPFCPVNSVPAWGQTLSIDPNQALFVLFGNRFGGDKNQGTFALPDLRDIAPKGMTYCVVYTGPYPMPSN